MNARIRAVQYALPQKSVTTEQLAADFPQWSVAKIDEKTGIFNRYIAGPDECASDLAVNAAEALFESGACSREEIDFILLCTQSPDYFLPTTACLIQDRLKIAKTAGALDFNLGCSGYVYGLGLAQGLLATGQARSLLLLTADTYSKFIHPRDRSVRTIFGDAAAATWLTQSADDEPSLGPFAYGTDGSGARNLMVPAGGLRCPHTAETAVESTDASGNVRSRDNIFMNGPEIFDFTMEVVPSVIRKLLKDAALTWDDVDLVIFHQTNQYMLRHLRQALRIPEEKFYLWFSSCGNTVSSTIPIALHHAIAEGRVREGSRILLAGWGVGYSWSATVVRWRC
jgi:3-oxoacyl-[acyl-carrier-protein] synthase III